MQKAKISKWFENGDEIVSDGDLKVADSEKHWLSILIFCLIETRLYICYKTIFNVQIYLLLHRLSSFQIIKHYNAWSASSYLVLHELTN